MASQEEDAHDATADVPMLGWTSAQAEETGDIEDHGRMVDVDGAIGMPMRKKMRLSFIPTDETCGSGNSTDDEKDQQAQVQNRLFALLKQGEIRNFVLLFNEQTVKVKATLLAAKDEVGFTLLMSAVKYTNLEVCKLLISHHVDVNEVNEKNNSALLLAAQKGLIDISQCLLNAGASEESRSAALVPAAHFGHLDVVYLLLRAGADPNYANQKGTTPLMRAAQEGQGAVVQALLRNRADANAHNKEGMTALMLASQRGHADIADILINAGALVDKQTRQGSTALLLAAKRGHAQAIIALLSSGADMFLKDERDKTALDNASRRGNEELIRILTIDNQQHLIKYRLRTIRNYTLMSVSTLYLHGRATLLPRQTASATTYGSWLVRAFGLPKPLFRSIAQFLPLCRTWSTQLRNLTHHVAIDSSQVVSKGLLIMNEVLCDAKLEVRYLPDMTGPGQLLLLREHPEYQALLTTATLGYPMPRELLQRLCHMANLQGVLAQYPGHEVIEFGTPVAQDVLAVLQALLEWDEIRRRFAMSETLGLIRVPRKQPAQNSWKLRAVALAAGACALLGVLTLSRSESPALKGVAPPKPTDFCVDRRFLTLAQLEACVNIIPFNSSDRDAAVAHLRTILPSYAFKELAKTEHTFGPYSIPAVDLDAELDVVANTTYPTDAAFQTALYNVFKHLRDAHTAYLKPSYYSSFYAFHPVSLKSFERNGSQVVQLDTPDRTEVRIYETFFPGSQVDTDISGWDVIAIDGKSAIDALRDFANTEIGLLKDDGTRFNMAVTGFETGRGWFVFRPLASFDIPKDDAVSYTLVHPTTGATKTLSYRWLGVNGAAFPGRTPPRSNSHRLEHLFARLKRHLTHHNFLDEKPTVAFHWLNDDVGVLSITQFSPSGDEDANLWTAYFGANITTALAEFTALGGKKLVLDLRGNGGGDICLGYATIRYLFPGLDPLGPREGVGPHSEAVYHLKQTPLFELLARAGENQSRINPLAARSEWVPNQWFDAATKRQYRDASWMTATSDNQHPTLGNVSQGVYYGCSAYDALFQAPGTSFPGLPKEDIVLVSHGYCGSTCSVFSSFIQMHDLAQTVAFGGYLGQPQQFFSFPGGQVYNSISVYIDAINLGVDKHPLVPKPLTTGAAFGFAMVAISPWQSPNATLPLEFQFVPATHYPLFPQDPLDAEALFEAAIAATSQ
ncbi:hypothetical protein ACHHYP_01013 [Achlya hypogyna]|uniref:Uncharacterized protein n=1 Tax=Achlya hypogyna TaxID=1202772 RepID=A0A1V9Z9R1_ACHHY|nr:hypothetical protein ACHHYP_01013 [Achlya hypogyna]